MRASSDWWSGFFEGLMVDFWRAAAPDDGAKPEADFIEGRLTVSPGARLLDVPCGHGRLALELASRGYRLTGLDISEDFLRVARASAESRHLGVEWLQGDMREIPPGARYDGAFCAGNSFGYFDDAGNAAFLRAVAGALKPGARFVLDSGWITEAILPNFRDSIEMNLQGLRFLAENVYVAETGRVENRFTVSRGKRKVERLASHRIYSYRELVAMLEPAGLEVLESYGSLSGESFRLGSHRLLLVSRKPA